MARAPDALQRQGDSLRIKEVGKALLDTVKRLEAAEKSIQQLLTATDYQRYPYFTYLKK